MKSRNIFRSLSIFSLVLSVMLLGTACDPGPRQGPKSGEAGEEAEAYGLQEEDLPGGDEEKQSATSQTGEDAYPEDKVLEDTNLDDDKPLELDGPLVIQQKKLMAMLNHQRTDLEAQIRNLEAQPGNSEDSSTIAENIENLRLYVDKLDKEMAQVYGAEEENFEDVAETAQAAIEGAGALIASRDMRISRSF